MRPVEHPRVELFAVANRAADRAWWITLAAVVVSMVLFAHSIWEEWA